MPHGRKKVSSMAATRERRNIHTGMGRGQAATGPRGRVRASGQFLPTTSVRSSHAVPSFLRCALLPCNLRRIPARSLLLSSFPLSLPPHYTPHTSLSSLTVPFGADSPNLLSSPNSHLWPHSASFAIFPYFHLGCNSLPTPLFSFPWSFRVRHWVLFRDLWCFVVFLVV